MIRPWVRVATVQWSKLLVGLVVLRVVSRLANVDLLWANVSLIVVGLEPSGTWTASLGRIRNTLIGCAAGLAALLLLPPTFFAMCLAVGAVVFLGFARLGPASGWKIAPITPLLVMAPAVATGTRALGLERGLWRVVEVASGSLLAVVVSLAFDAIARTRRPAPSGAPRARGDGERGPDPGGAAPVLGVSDPQASAADDAPTLGADD